MNFEDISKSYLTYLQTHYGSNVAIVFDGYPSDVNGNSAKSAERIRPANLHSSHEIIFNEATCPETSQGQFLANERNMVRFIDLLKKFLQEANVTVKQAVEDADVLIVETAVSVKSQYDNIFVVGEGIDLSVLLTGLSPMKENLFFRKCGKGRTPDVLYSTTSFKYKFSRMILFIHAFSGCDTTSALFGHGITKSCSLLGKKPTPGRKNTTTKARSTLARLPPTVDAIRFHDLRSYLQIQKWLGHEKNPLEWGWVPTRFGLSPCKMERDAAPESLLKIISCNCKKRCKNACGYRKAGLICSSLCTCSLGEACENVSDINLLEDSIEDEDDTPSSINNFIYEDIENLYLQVDEEDKEQQTELEDFRPSPSKRQKL
ncbi:hypothetical protein AVEN_220465-1 [Araneus ventricosus]|uniref:Tesmin/TSO1-like CXC domain-containing protein n=1 Tax=Araneus ventricosus TaxID=182803 RepID=A0A4Y2UCW3_ARAVE|nr:hypothetical protein AVEN_74086-1 [Araneus ventricosus]GBO09401.1 hypothetical protein AVEN_220465-1 [Araneus ventricosus]